MRFALVGLALLLAAPSLTAQTYIPRNERGDPSARAQTDLDGNRVRTSVYNFGQSGRTSATPAEIPYEWPAGTRQHYMALTGLLVGAEVESETGASTTIVDIPNYRSNFDDPNRAWTWIPVPEYAADGGIARSDRPETWPAVWPDQLGDADDPGWPGSWNGLLGKDAVIDGVETYVHYTDDQYDRNRRSSETTYIPDATDPDRAGLGIVVSERRLAFRDAAVEDVVFTVRDLYNAGTQDLDAVAATIWLADLIGGDADAQDDQLRVDIDRGLILFVDADGDSTDPAFPPGQTVGAVALVLLETPGALEFSNVQVRPAGGINFQTFSDATLYQEVMAPGEFDASTPPGTDNDTFASVGLFPLAAGGSARLATALVFGEVDYTANDFETRYAEILAKTEAARALYADGFIVAGETGAAADGVALLGAAPNPSRGATRIAFSLDTPQAARLEVYDLLGRRVATLADGLHAGGTHTVSWQGATAGVYLARLITPGGVQTRTLTVLR